MCKIVRNNNEAHNFLKVKMLDDDWDLEANEEFLVTSCLYVFGLIGDVENANFVYVCKCECILFLLFLFSCMSEVSHGLL